jgi:hypothetical protein
LRDNDGTAQPAAPENCWDTFTFNNCGTWIMMEQLNLQHQKSKLLDTFTFSNNSTCTWDNDGTAQPPTEQTNCWDTFTFNNLYLYLG